MLTFIVRRTLWTVVVMFVITVIVFVIFFKTPGVDPAHHRVRSAALVLPPDQAFKDAAKDMLVVREGLAHATV